MNTIISKTLKGCGKVFSSIGNVLQGKANYVEKCNFIF